MHPILLELGPITIYSYGMTLVVAFLTATWLASRADRELPIELRVLTADQIMDVACWLMLGGILGGRLFYVALHWGFFAEAPRYIPAIWHGGLVWYGGFLGGVLACWLYARARQLEFLRVADFLVPFLALGQAIGRVGCFLNGCCYGKPTEAWCGVVFPGERVAVLPTQLFEALGLLVLYVVLRSLQRPVHVRHPGRLLGVYLMGYAGLRMVIEFFRGDQSVVWAGLTLQQLISLAAFLLGLGLVRRTVKLASHEP